MNLAATCRQYSCRALMILALMLGAPHAAHACAACGFNISLDATDRQLYIPAEVVESGRIPGSGASDTLIVPGGTAAYGGVSWYGVSLIGDRTAGHADTEGAVAFGFGFGSPKSAVALSITASDVSGAMPGHFVNLKWHFLNETATRPALAVGVDNLLDLSRAMSHDEPSMSKRSAYLACAKTFWHPRLSTPLFQRLHVTLGYGTGERNDSVFGGLSASITANSKALIEYDGKAWNVGYSLAPLKNRTNLVLVLGVAGIDRGSDRDWIVGVGWSEYRGK